MTPRNNDPTIGREPWLDFSSGYVRRAMTSSPQAPRPLEIPQNYARDLLSLRYAKLG